MSKWRTPPALYMPKIGEVVRDRAHAGAEGVYMGTVGGRVYLRPRGGGKEWETYPSEIEPAVPAPELVLSLRPDTRNRAPGRLPGEGSA